MSGVETVEREARELVRRRGIDPVTEQGVVRLLVDDNAFRTCGGWIVDATARAGRTVQVSSCRPRVARR